MIRSFKCAETAKIFRRTGSKRYRPIQKIALRKLLLIEGAERLDDMRVPPGNRLEKLTGDRSGLHSIRINAQWRICFRWEGDSAWDVEIVDYH
ncbi:MAG TPA: type II toxin-antitoxin system RelE/ParE family toxin [Tepidisphaeraceae bacterium]|nr:type II toxin-antitoxin system RelE/ParE family toxin [Tepidisphaeraceae bacterium]